MHAYDLILTLTAGLSAALLFGFITQRIGLSPIVGYLLAGTLVGPYTPGYVADASIAENIAFGVDAAHIDRRQVELAAERAALASFIATLPNGYATVVGERGVRLSGGQRQRIGIARALYKQATVLIFDEATSALDAETERAVMEAVRELPAELTVIIIAHRMTTVDYCEQVVAIEAGLPSIVRSRAAPAADVVRE